LPPATVRVAIGDDVAFDDSLFGFTARTAETFATLTAMESRTVLAVFAA